MKDSPASDLFPNVRIAIVDGDRTAAEMLHTFFRLMDLESSLVEPDLEAAATIRRLRADVAIVDLDLPDLRALEIARELRGAEPPVAIVFCTERSPVPKGAVAKAKESYERALALLEKVLAAV